MVRTRNQLNEPHLISNLHSDNQSANSRLNIYRFGKVPINAESSNLHASSTASFLEKKSQNSIQNSLNAIYESQSQSSVLRDDIRSLKEQHLIFNMK